MDATLAGRGWLGTLQTARLLRPAFVRCDNGVPTLSGESKVASRDFSFDGLVHRDGRRIVRTGSSGSLSGTWNGEC